MTICLRSYPLEVAVGTFFPGALGFSNNSFGAYVPLVELRTALNEGMPPRAKGFTGGDWRSTSVSQKKAIHRSNPSTAHRDLPEGQSLG